MFGNATLAIPEDGFIGPVTLHSLSDQLAMLMGRTAAWTLSDSDGYVVVTLSDGVRRLIGLDIANNQLVFGRLSRPYK